MLNNHQKRVDRLEFLVYNVTIKSNYSWLQLKSQGVSRKLAPCLTHNRQTTLTGYYIDLAKKRSEGMVMDWYAEMSIERHNERVREIERYAFLRQLRIHWMNGAKSWRQPVQPLDVRARLAHPLSF